MRISLLAVLAWSSAFCWLDVCADLPVHCLHHEILGEWSFKLSDAKPKGYRYEKCSNAKDSFNHGDYGVNGHPVFEPKAFLDVTLSHPNHAKAHIDGKDVHGKWTMIYDEAFEVVLAGRKFFAFSHFDPNQGKKGLSGEGPAAIKRKAHASNCHATLPGWFHNLNEEGNPSEGTWGCYYAIKHGSKDVYAKGVNRKTRKKKDEVEFLEEPSKMYIPETQLVQEHNSRVDRTWDATLYPQLFDGLSMKQLHMLGGSSRKSARHIKAAAPTVDKAALAAEVKTSDLPEAFDWSDVKGKNYVGKVVNQGSCGSCYAVASADMLSTRLRIKAKKPLRKAGPEHSKVSAQSVLDCSEYNQACSGGFPFLVQKYGSEFGLQMEQQTPYRGKNMLDVGSESRTWVNTCKKSPPAAKIGKYGYVGGFYGACTEAAMKREIKDHGPIVMAYDVTPEFYSYHRGVFQSSKRKPSTRNEFEETNHAVMITGWGADKGKPYWRVKNSWGPQWGENGFFRILRGKDELASESMAVMGHPQFSTAQDTGPLDENDKDVNNIDEDEWDELA